MYGSIQVMSVDELIRILETFDEQDFAPMVQTARQLLQLSGVSVKRNAVPVPTRELCDIYKARASNPNVPAALSRQAGLLAQVAARFPEERWYLYVINISDSRLTIFSNEHGHGRVCIDFEMQ